MGVHGLWKLIDAAGKPVPVETLENRILAIDVSIWLHQLVKGFQDSTGGAGVNAHLLGLFYRICKLLFFRIKPVFVFDGGVPALKRNTIAARQSNRNKANESLEKIRHDLLQNLLKQHALGKILGQNVKIPKGVTSKTDSMFFLPPLPSSSSNDEIPEQVAGWQDSEKSSSSEYEDEYDSSSDDSGSPRKKYGDIHSIDLKSKDFKSLPADMRHDILSELKETRKQNSWAKVHLMPEDVGDFSSFQMERLLKRRSVQVELEEAEKEMGPKCFTVSEIQEILEYQGVDVSKKSQRIASDSTTRFLYSTQKSPEKDKNSKLESISERGEELDSDIDDPLIDVLKSSEDMSQEEILKLIREEETKKKTTDLEKDCGKTTKNANELTPVEIRTSEVNPGPGKIQESISTSTKKQVTFHNKQVTQLLRQSSKKSFLPISKMDKVLERKKKKNMRKKIVRKVSTTGPNLSESDTSDSDVSDKINKQISSDNSNQELEMFSSQDTSQQSQHELEKDEAYLILPQVSLSSVENKKASSNSSDKSDSDDFEEVTIENKLDSSVDKDFTTLISSVEQIKAKNSTDINKSVNIELSFNKPPSDEEDIFADIFETTKIPQREIGTNNLILNKTNLPDTNLNNSNSVLITENVSLGKSNILSEVKLQNKPIVETEKNSDSTICSDINVPVDENISTDLNIKNPDLKQKDMLDEVFNESKVPSSKYDEKNIEKLETFVDVKQAERAVILEELIIAKSKLEEEVGIVKSPSSIKLTSHNESDNDLEDVEEVKVAETQESLEDKNYFTNDKYVSEIKNKPERSPESFAKKLSSVEQVRQFQSTLERESASLIKEKVQNEKIAKNLSQQITFEAQKLLRLFGIPYLVAPMEAEAQCAFLDMNGLTQGTITDDSDIWLFGANNVYKNFFDQKKYVKLFKATDIHKVYNLGRDELIMIGLLVGSDYTSGLNGVGPVTALEIVANFPQDDSDLTPPRDRLARFASAFLNHKLNKKLSNKLLPVQLIEGFPSLDVVKAYTFPQVDDNKETFSWGSPNMELIREYAMDKFGWDANKTDKTLAPIIEKLKQNKTQMTLHGFFDWAFDDVQGKMSRRVESAINLLGTSPTKRAHLEDEDSPPETPREKAKKVLTDEKLGKRKKRKNLQSTEEVPSTSTTSALDVKEDITSQSSSQHQPIAGPSTYDPYTPLIKSELKPQKKEPRKKEQPVIPMLPRVNATIEKLRKGKSLSGKPRERKSRSSVSLTKPVNELDFDIPFGTGETRKRKKVHRTDEEKVREIEEARAKAARVLAKLKNVEQFHNDL